MGASAHSHGATDSRQPSLDSARGARLRTTGAAFVF